jgi:hypothetical protein
VRRSAGAGSRREDVPVIGATAAELRAVALAATDASGYFAAMYAGVTTRVAGAIARGDFEDGPRMDRFADTFASYYLRPLRRELAVPRCWQATWDVAGDPGLVIVQHLVLGINAHVNHDLAQTVVQLADETGDLQSVRVDFDVINDVLAATYHDVLANLDRVSRWVNSAARLGGGRAFNFSLRVAREQAWGAAVRMFPLDAGARAAYVHELDELVSVLAYLITRPGFPMSALAGLASRLEEHDPKVVTTALLGS